MPLRYAACMHVCERRPRPERLVCVRVCVLCVCVQESVHYLSVPEYDPTKINQVVTNLVLLKE